MRLHQQIHRQHLASSTCKGSRHRDANRTQGRRRAAHRLDPLRESFKYTYNDRRDGPKIAFSLFKIYHLSVAGQCSLATSSAYSSTITHLIIHEGKHCFRSYICLQSSRHLPASQGGIFMQLLHTMSRHSAHSWWQITHDPHLFVVPVILYYLHF